MGKPTGRDVRRGSGEVGYIDHRTSISRTEQCPCLTAVLELGSWLKIRILLRVTYLSPRYQLPAFSSNFVMSMLYCCLSVCPQFSVGGQCINFVNEYTNLGHAICATLDDKS